MIDRETCQNTYNCLLATTIGWDLGAEIEPPVTLYLGTGVAAAWMTIGPKARLKRLRANFMLVDGMLDVGDFCFVVKDDFFIKKKETDEASLL